MASITLSVFAQLSPVTINVLAAGAPAPFRVIPTVSSAVHVVTSAPSAVDVQTRVAVVGSVVSAQSLSPATTSYRVAPAVGVESVWSTPNVSAADV